MGVASQSTLGVVELAEAETCRVLGSCRVDDADDVTNL